VTSVLTFSTRPSENQQFPVQAYWEQQNKEKERPIQGVVGGMIGHDMYEWQRNKEIEGARFLVLTDTGLAPIIRNKISAGDHDTQMCRV